MEGTLLSAPGSMKYVARGPFFEEGLPFTADPFPSLHASIAPNMNPTWCHAHLLHYFPRATTSNATDRKCVRMVPFHIPNHALTNPAFSLDFVFICLLFSRFILRACLHDVRIVSSSKVVLTIPVLPSRPSSDDGSARPPSPIAQPHPSLPPRGGSTASSDNNDEGASQTGEETDGQGEGGGEEAVGNEAPPATSDAGATVPLVWSEGRTEWKGDTLTALRTPLFVLEVVVVGEKGNEVFAYTQRLLAVKESALVLIDKAIASTQVTVRWFAW